MSDDASALPQAILFGALRSGTTLLRLMVDAHPDLHNPGEFDPFFDHIHEENGVWRYDRDALSMTRLMTTSGLDMPEDLDGQDMLRHLLGQVVRGQGALSINLHRNIAKAARLLPEAKVIHLMRDPRDVARSSIGMGWSGNAYGGVGHWIGTEQTWRAAALPAERVLEMTYEDLLRHPEQELTRLCRFLGAEWSERMLDYPATSTYGPVDASAAERWRVAALAKEVSFVESRIPPHLMGPYAWSETGPRRPSPLWRLWLLVEDRLKRFRFGARRHGAAIMLAEKLTRWFGITGAHRRVRQRINRLEASHLK